MFLMNVPTVAATGSEWITGGPPQGYSLPLFNDSDTELSGSGPPISDKLEMLIDSLRSSQLSSNMDYEIEGNAPSGQEVHSQFCKVGMGPFVGPMSNTKGPTENQRVDISLPVNCESQGSDSDDSVDRGIEEAILEYLKEKNDHKRKAEPSTNVPLPSKIPRKNPLIPEISKQHSDTNKVLTASNHFLKNEVETPTAPILTMKKHIKKKTPFNENPVNKMNTNNGAMTNSISTREQMQYFPKTNCIKVNYPVTVEGQEDSPDSSSDDGIEEAIQRYQLEKKEKQNRSMEACEPQRFKEELESSSDDGIEEAIRCYQLEQQKGKSVFKPLFHKQKHISQSTLHPSESTSTDNFKKHKLRKKKKRTAKKVSVVLPPSSFSKPKSTLIGTAKCKGNGAPSSEVEPLREQHIPATPKVNTTTELICAEAILDISKAVMPAAFVTNVGLSDINPTQPLSHPSNFLDGGSDDSSVDSEDGIEQEIRKFLEQKAQMHKQPPNSAAITAEPDSMKEPENVKTKQDVLQKKAGRLSLTAKRKNKEEKCNISKEPVIDHKINENMVFKSLQEHIKGSSSLVYSERIETQPSAELEKMERSGDKSSSLDSDEDLDTAIKDLLKTKKKLTKRERDMKLETRFKNADLQLRKPLQAKTIKTSPISKHGGLKKLHKSRYGTRENSKLSKQSMLQFKKSNKKSEQIIQMADTDKQKGAEDRDFQMQHNNLEENSSVDSDDSIEQEIRKFLAEKAKTSTTAKTKEENLQSKGAVEACSPFPDTGIKLENQLAEIPRNFTPLSEPALPSPENKTSHDKEEFPTTQTALPKTSSSPATTSASSPFSALSDNPILFEPADGAGAARTEKRRFNIKSSTIQNLTPDMGRGQPHLSPNIAQSYFNAKWHHSLGPPTTETRGAYFGGTQFPFTSFRNSENESAALPCQRGDITTKPQTSVSIPGAVTWSSRSSPSFHSSSENLVSTMPAPTFFNPLSAVRLYQGTSFLKSIAPEGHRSSEPRSEQNEVTAYNSSEQGAFVKLASNRSTHIQVQSREMSKRGNLTSKEEEGESMRTDVQLGRAENVVDKKGSDSDERGNLETKKGFSTLLYIGVNEAP
ncbi:protein phosphatase 1 regulatory subunit 26 [Lampris incognitus]|uniref:protein phosphatase 1 regulatory subunit 26 n=1 Tax=Lampris incognitus TaxID=2546036 RepID=UPI0024B4CE6C|nr:protein phosphatase 1 regulatory subunit 26 [Lampris incognitus]